MSLLMDALKRAEKSRQAQSQPEPEGPDPGETQGLSLDPLEPDGLSASAPAGAPAPEDDDSEPRLELPPDVLERALEDSMEDSLDRALGDSREGRGDSGGFSLVDDPDLLEDTSATLPSIKLAQESVNDYFDGTRSISLSMDAVQAAADPEEGATTAEREQVDTGRQRAARAVFDAKTPARRNQRRWAAAGMMLIVLLAIVAGGGYLYWDPLAELLRDPSVTPRRAASPPQVSVARSRAETPAPAPAVQPVRPVPRVPTPAPAPEPPAQVAAVSPATPAPAPSSAPVAAAAPAPSAEVMAAPPVAQVMQAAASGEEPAPITADQLGPGETLTARIADAIDQSGLRPQGTMGRAGIKIAKESVPPRVHPLLNRGYEAFQAGEFGVAEKAYREVLRHEPANRDALLGLGAVAVRVGDRDAASRIYYQLLNQNPRDAVAQSALISMAQNVDPVAAESRIKDLLRGEPDAGYLHFSLGSLYAVQERWPEAQEAFFNAFRQNSRNADYAYNLAVSLDRLVQEPAALSYYRLALDLAEKHDASFSRSAVEQRVESMTAARIAE